MLFIRSTLFNLVFYINLVMRLIHVIPAILKSDQTKILSQAKSWASSSIWLLEKIAKTKIEIEGQENIPQGGFILAAQHQSFWDTFALLPLLENPVFIFKKELLKFPIFGRSLLSLDMIPIDRSARGTAMTSVLQGARLQVKEKDRQLIIFPEGTRRSAGAPLEYKHGVGRIYADIKVPIVPVALVSGLFWPRHSFLRQRGLFKIKILPPINPGLSSNDVMKQLVDVTDRAYDDLLLAAEADNPHLRLSKLVKTRLGKIRETRKSAL